MSNDEHCFNIVPSQCRILENIHVKAESFPAEYFRLSREIKARVRVTHYTMRMSENCRSVYAIDGPEDIRYASKRWHI